MPGVGKVPGSVRMAFSSRSTVRRAPVRDEGVPVVGTYPDLAELMVLAQAGRVTLHTQKYPLDKAVDALHDLDAGKVRGRAVLVP